MTLALRENETNRYTNMCRQADQVVNSPHQERQQALEKMGISVQTSGIKVEQDKNFLVNLNADPSLNELLVYYLKVGILLLHVM